MATMGAPGLRTARAGVGLIAGGRLLLGVVAVLRPELATRPWVGLPAQDRHAAKVLGRALGGRDIALATGALWALHRDRGGSQVVGWAAAGACADAVDVLATVASWSALPRTGRVLVVAAAAGAATLGAAATGRLLRGR